MARRTGAGFEFYIEVGSGSQCFFMAGQGELSLVGEERLVPGSIVLLRRIPQFPPMEAPIQSPEVRTL